MKRARVSLAYVQQLAGRLAAREQAVVCSIGQTRVLTGGQVERLHFHELAPASRSVVRRRVLGRLVELRVLTTLQRRIGGVRAGSSGLTYALDTAGQQLCSLLDGQLLRDGQRVRRPWTPGQLFLAHSLDVAELFVQLHEAARRDPFQLTTFLTEPASWAPNGLSGWLKPDAYAVLATEHYADAVWLEVDRATETLPTIRRKLAGYVDFVARGQLGPDAVVPRVVITVPDQRRQEAVAGCLAAFPSAPAGLFTVVLHGQAVGHLVASLLGPEGAAEADA